MFVELPQVVQAVGGVQGTLPPRLTEVWLLVGQASLISLDTAACVSCFLTGLAAGTRWHGVPSNLAAPGNGSCGVVRPVWLGKPAYAWRSSRRWLRWQCCWVLR